MEKVYLAVDDDSSEWIYENPPIRGEDCNGKCWINDGEDDPLIRLPKGTIKKLIGKELTWNDEPYDYLGDN